MVFQIRKSMWHGATNSDYTGVTLSNATRDAWQGVQSKMIVAHPHRSSRDVGAIAFKRIRCSGSKCVVFRTGYCIKKKKSFESAREDKATEEELKAFAAAARAAFDNKGTHYASLKSNYKCDEEDQTAVDAWLTMV
jgi:hypothetical protein